MKIKNLNENNNRFMLLGSIFSKFPDLSSEDEDYLNSLSTNQLVSEIKNRGWEDILDENLSKKTLDEYWDKIEDTPYYKVASKSVMDSDGFWTDYTMYYDEDEDMYFFIFGDNDLYGPDPAYADWTCDSNDEAVEWYNNYTGFEDDDIDESLKGRLTMPEPLALDEDLFDVEVALPDAVPQPELPEITTESEPSTDIPAPGPEFGISTLLNNLIQANWDLNSSYNDLVVNAGTNNLPEIAEIAKEIAAEINNHIGKLQAALGTISPNVENISAGEEEVLQQVEQSPEENTDDISQGESIDEN